MTLKTELARLTPGYRVGLPLLIAIALLVPGCAGKRIELLTSLLTPKDALVDAEGEKRLTEEQTDESAGKSSQIAAKASVETVDQPAAGEVTPRVTVASRIRSLLSRREQEVATSDPFIDEQDEHSEQDVAANGSAVDAPKKPVAASKGQTVEELFASFEKKTPIEASTHVKPWWESDAASEVLAANVKGGEVKLAEEFDSRLERLRSELATSDVAAGAPRDRSSDVASVDPFAVDRIADSSRNHSSESHILEASRPIFDDSDHPLMTEQHHPATTPEHANARQRVKGMMVDAHQDWENWNLRKAYRTALAAQELAVLENVSFAPDEERPQHLAEQIAAELRGDAITTVASTHAPATTDVNPFAMEDTSRSAIGFPQFGGAFALPEETMTVKATEAPQANSPASTETNAETLSSGVNLLPPDDDFPSEAVGGWRNGTSAISDGVDRADDGESIQLAGHKVPGFTLTRAQQPREQLSGMSVEDNQELLTSVAEQRTRVLKSHAAKWPTLPSPDRYSKLSREERGPIRVAEAPRFSLDEELAVASGDEALAVDGAAPNSSLLGQFWRSQPVWFICGLVLLVIALRLLPWPRNDSA